jgi:hypothetical protein
VVLFLRTLGILAIVGGLLWMVVAELFLEESRGGQVRLLLLAGVLLLAISLLVSALGRVGAKVAGRRCPRCGKAVAHGHIYCSDHLREAVNQFRDSQRRKDDGG